MDTATPGATSSSGGQDIPSLEPSRSAGPSIPGASGRGQKKRKTPRFDTFRRGKSTRMPRSRRAAYSPPDILAGGGVEADPPTPPRPLPHREIEATASARPPAPALKTAVASRRRRPRPGAPLSDGLRPGNGHRRAAAATPPWKPAPAGEAKRDDRVAARAR